MRRILLAFLFTVAVTGLAFGAVNNIKVSGDITSEAITRDLSLGNQDGSSIDSEDFLLTQVRLRFDADLTENVAAVVQLINERVWGLEQTEGNAGNTDIDLDLAYLVMKEMLYDPLTLIIGRQNLRFGRALIIGDPDTDNEVVSSSGKSGIADDLSQRKAFDAVRATLDYDPLIIDLIYAKVQEGTTNIEDDVTLFGVNAAYALDDDTLVEGYFFGKDKDQASAGDDNDKVYVLGLRAETAPLDQLSVYGEYAYQFGDRRVSATDHDHIDAFAVQAGAEYAFNDEWNSKAGIEYTYLSGDDNGSNYEAWNPMFEDQRVGEIANLLFDNTNLQYVKLSGSTMPQEDITAALQVYYLRLAEKISSFTAGSPILSSYTYGINDSEKDIGWELDASVVYDYTEDVQLGVVSGLFLPGDLFTTTNDETAYSIRALARVDF